jgi:hypothetical protein
MGLMGDLTKHWAILVTIASFLVAWGANTAVLRANEAADQKVEDRVVTLEQTVARELAQIKAAQAAQAATSVAQSQSIERIDRNIEALLQEMRRQ